MRRRAERLGSSDSEGEGYVGSYASGSPQMFEMSESEDSNDATVYYSPTAPSPPQGTNMAIKGKPIHVCLNIVFGNCHSQVVSLDGKFLVGVFLGLGRTLR